jgi:SAM-dependent methyltransferase
MGDLLEHRATPSEKRRSEDLMRLLPKNRSSVLDVGARDGYFSLLMAEHFARVVALDLHPPAIRHPGVTALAGDATALCFPDRSFDCVFCAEVLEHIPALERACREIARVARYEILIGTPFRQDIRLGRTTCRACGHTNPPWGHLRSFDELELRRLFPGFEVVAKSFVGSVREVTNPLSVLLMDLAGNPWGTYQQDEPCVRCGAKLTAPPAKRTWRSRICSGLAGRINLLQSVLVRPRAKWIHLLFARNQTHPN